MEPHVLVSHAMLPYFTAFIAVVCYGALGPIIKKTGVAMPPLLFIGISTSLLAIGAFIMLYITDGRAGFYLPERSKLIGFIAFALINLLGFVLYMHAIKHIPVAQYDMIASLGILVTALFAAVMLGEPLHLRYVPAAVFILIGLRIAIGPDLWGK
jgi:drug/metabolite transporter (DMT)-like permease